MIEKNENNQCIQTLVYGLDRDRGNELDYICMEEATAMFQSGAVLPDVINSVLRHGKTPSEREWISHLIGIYVGQTMAYESIIESTGFDPMNLMQSFLGEEDAIPLPPMENDNMDVDDVMKHINDSIQMQSKPFSPDDID